MGTCCFIPWFLRDAQTVTLPGTVCSGAALMGVSSFSSLSFEKVGQGTGKWLGV